MSICVRIALFGIAAFLSAAAEAADIPTYPALVCEKYCQKYVAAKPTEPWPASYAPGANGSGFVDMSFLVGVDGQTKDIIVERTVGSEKLVQAALDTLKRVVYRPATEDGKPVAENERFRFEFADPKEQGGDYASSNCDDPKAGKAPTATMRELLTDRLCSARREAMSGNYNAALASARIATIDDGRWLDATDRERAFRLRVELEAQAGEYVEALAAFETLQKVADAPLVAGDPDVAQMSRFSAQFDDDKPLITAGVVASGGGDPIWQHVLDRRTFAFDAVTGKLDRFTLRCGTHSFASPVVDKGAWNVPMHWGGCVIYVFGTANSTFNFVESSNPAVARESRRQ